LKKAAPARKAGAAFFNGCAAFRHSALKEQQSTHSIWVGFASWVPIETWLSEQ